LQVAVVVVPEAASMSVRAVVVVQAVISQQQVFRLRLEFLRL
jgi:hypothetical protein